MHHALCAAARHQSCLNRLIPHGTLNAWYLVDHENAAISPAITTLVKGTLESMAYARRKLALGISVAIILMGSATTVVLSSGLAGETLPAADIIKRAQAKYASLTNYSDEGRSIATIDGMTITTEFTIRLAQTNLYRIEWQQNRVSSFSAIKTKAQAVWSAGEGDFLELGSGAIRQVGLEMALAGATGISGGAADTIPGIFFKLNWGNQFGDSVLSEKQQADEKVGDVDCYVFTSDSKGPTRTLWIGRQDFLIHQVRTVTSAEAMKTVLAEAAKRNPEKSALLHTFEPQDSTSTETHGNIVVNQQFSNGDFIP
jgi:outer membrane lipoprotein-sorting protein